MHEEEISQSGFIDLLLELRFEIEKDLIVEFENNFKTGKDERRLKFEAMIFSLWMVTLCISQYKSEIKDMLHNKFAEKYWGVDGKEIVFNEIDIRYNNYYEAFRIWQNNPQSGHMIGTVMLEIIKNQNTDFSFNKELPYVDMDEALKAFLIFNKLLNISYKMVEEINRKYKTML